MTKADKLLARMRNNPRDWSIEDLKSLATLHGIEWETRHQPCNFQQARQGAVDRSGTQADYVSRFVAVIDDVRSLHDD